MIFLQYTSQLGMADSPSPPFHQMKTMLQPYADGPSRTLTVTRRQQHSVAILDKYCFFVSHFAIIAAERYRL